MSPSSSYRCCLCLKENKKKLAVYKFRLILNTDENWNWYRHYESTRVYLCRNCYNYDIKYNNLEPDNLDDLELSETGFDINSDMKSCYKCKLS